MQIQITFTCRQCGHDKTLTTDTSDYGLIEEGWDEAGLPIPLVETASLIDLLCSCGQVSGELALGYRFREAYRPSH